ncbi:hypothetical protein DFJ77DRAFT_459500 [Powellomyces hirtus]|nr:hypothetical protein DFJ77DRAFT_459500 [Powellomyces hirtus]
MLHSHSSSSTSVSPASSPPPFEAANVPLDQELPLYSGTLLVPTQAARSVSQRYYFMPPNAISGVVLSQGRGLIISANVTQRKLVDFYTPEGMSFDEFHRHYVPSFVELPLNGSRLLVNPHRIVEIYVNSDKPHGTIIDIENDRAGRGDNAKGTTTKTIHIPLGIQDVLRKIDPNGFQIVRGDLFGRDLGFGRILS